MDNASIHLTKELLMFYNNRILKILFGIPYMSSFNMIDYLFRYVKKIICIKNYIQIFK